MTAMPFRLRVLRAITDTLKTITPGNGYINDMSDFDPGDGNPMSRVYRGRAWFGDSDPIPMLSVLEAATPADEVLVMPADAATGEFDWPLLVQGFVNDDKQNPTDPAYYLEADVRRCLLAEKVRRAPGGRQPDPFGLGITGPNKILKLSLGFGSVRPADDISARAYFWLPVTLRIIDRADAAFA